MSLAEADEFSLAVSLYWARVRSRGGRPEQASEKWRGEMTRYLISFDDGAMDFIPVWLTRQGASR
jgi:hypothetical protein